MLTGNNTKLTELSDVKPGNVTFFVTANGIRSELHTMTFMTYPATREEITGLRATSKEEPVWVRVLLLNERSYKYMAERHNPCFYTDSSSLRDMGIIDNNYNDHKSFKLLKDAEEYLEYCLTGKRP